MWFHCDAVILEHISVTRSFRHRGTPSSACCLPCLRVCFHESQLRINHFTSCRASHAALPHPSKSAAMGEKKPPLPLTLQQFHLPSSGSVFLMTCFDHESSQTGSRYRNTTDPGGCESVEHTFDLQASVTHLCPDVSIRHPVDKLYRL